MKYGSRQTRKQIRQRQKRGRPIAFLLVTTGVLGLASLDNQFHSDGGGKHQWAEDELDVSVIALPKGANTVTFTLDVPGTYTFYCDICCGGRVNPTMQGTLIVEA